MEKSKIILYYVYGSKQYDPIEHIKSILVRESNAKYFTTLKEAQKYALDFNMKHTRSKLYIHKITLNIDYYGMVKEF